MNQYLKTIQDLLQQNNQLSEEGKQALLKTLTDADKQWSITEFKLDRTEKVKRTTAILLEETIEELEQKRKAVEEQNRELEIGNSLERVRTVAMGMQRPADMPEICRVISQQLESLGIKEIRNVQTAIFHEDKGTYTNYEYYRLHDKMLITEVDYTSDKISSDFAAEMIAGTNRIFTRSLSGQALKDWFNFQKTTNVFIDTNLENATSLTYYWFSLGPVALGISTYHPLNEEEINLFKRFRNVFELSYRRYLDIEKAEAQAREAQIELALERVRARTMAMQRSEELGETAVLLFKQIADLGAKSWSSGFQIWQSDDRFSTAWMTNPDGSMGTPFTLPYTGDPFFKRIYEARKSGNDFLVMESSGEELKETYRYMFSLPEVKEVMGNIESLGFQLPTFQITHCAFFLHGFLMIITYEPVPELWDIFKRFAKVFEQTYTRFLDLKNAEEQARESQIQLALERVRARTMAMQRSDELQDVALLLMQQVKDLGIKAWATGFNIWKDDNKSYIDWMTGPTGEFMEPYNVDLMSHPIFRAISEARQKGEDFHVFDLGGEGLAETYKLLEKFVNKKEFERFLESGFQVPARQINHYVFGAEVSLLFITYDPVPEAHDIFRRFGKTFEQTYTRFLDLQKAEAQARESQIQLAMERVRARTMAMQKSDELTDAASLLFKQLEDLGIKSWSSGFNIWQADGKSATINMCNPDGSIATPYHLPHTEDIFFIRICEARQRGDDLLVMETGGKELEETYNYMFSLPEVKKVLGGMEDTGFQIPKFQVNHCAFFSQGYLMFITYEPVPEMWDIFKRFAKVFEQTYTRFLDLQKAEAQAREAQIEAALERVRSRTMGMQHSEELQETALLLFQQVLALGVSQLGCGFNIWDDDMKAFTSWMGGGLGENTVVPTFKVPTSEDIFLHIREAAERGESLFVKEQSGEELEKHYRYMFSLPLWKDIMKGWTPPSYQVVHCAFFTEGFLMFVSTKPIPQAHDIFKRFAKVFEQTYTRFLDLQKAEAQAREARIEAALERVRSRTMAMQKSEELQSAALLLFQQIQALGAKYFAAGFNIWDEDRKAATAWMAREDALQPPFKTSSSEDVFLKISEAANGGESLFVEEQGGEKLEVHYKYMASIPIFRDVIEKMAQAGLSVPTFQIIHCAFFSHGYLMFISYEPATESYDIFKRFAKVFEQTYTRFLDLQKAEAQALEAIKRASVDRVRAEIASMRTTDDLERIQPLVWNELKTLGVPFTRCGVFIMDEEQQKVQTLLSTPDGKAIATLHVPFEFDLSIITNGVSHWRKKEIYKEYWDTAAFTKAWVKLSSLRDTSMDSPQAEHPPENLYLHMLPFLQGMLYVGNDAPLNEDELQLVQNLADAFATAYARYEDFNKLESAKQQVEKTLVDLKQAQAQLVQSEKMASLGELTAGIAHEIQNPLNFVNNFSDVSNELLDEMKTELKKGNTDEAMFIAEDVQQNLEKILHHGKRADAIVKGMLQHSRSSSGVKEPTDINALADEYLRLAYHGLRAKDKSFNAKFETDFDKTLSADEAGVGKINIIPQDIGRVLVNLISNAFYAVTEKSTSAKASASAEALSGKGYEPTVTVTTKKEGDKVFVSVKDNGNGIPQKVLDKIFQPFFTTKPTGQGTGLGLSLSYDIITKGHGGELKVETKEQEGSKFIIQLPLKDSN